MRKFFVIFSIFTFLTLFGSVNSLSVGTAPGVLDLGEVKPGEEVYFKFYLTTNSRSDLLVYMSPVPVHVDMYYRNQTRRYTFLPAEASQQDIASWIEILNNPVVLSPSNVKIIYLPDGGIVRANAEVNVRLRVPKNAEPCYYAYSINLSPKLAGGGAGMGVSTIAVTRFIFVFKVAGEGRRAGEIIDILADREAEDKARIDVLFKNRGTCTVQARVNSLKLYDEFGNLTTTVSSGLVRVAPDQTAVLSTFWVGDVKEGNYRVEATVDYITGSAEFAKTITIPEIIKPKPPAKVCEVPWSVMVWVIIFSILIFIIKPKYWNFFVAILLIVGALIVLSCLIPCGISTLFVIPIGMFILATLLIIYGRSE